MTNQAKREGAVMTRKVVLAGAPLLLLLALGYAVAQLPSAPASDHFQPAETCMACHNGLSTAAGEDISIGFNWRASMMANAALDPYWHAAVRREIIDFPESRAEIENECSTCHMPMANFEARAKGGAGEVFAHLPAGSSAHPLAPLALEGVSCTVCHQIQGDNFGQPESFTGGFLIDRDHPFEGRRIFGRFDVDAGRASVMQSASGFRPAESAHIRQSEMCATCHTLATHALGAGAGVRLPEQMPYQEWLESDFRDQRSCQSCHMPVVQDSTAISSVLGQPRSGVSRHTFVGGNFFMLRVLNRYRAELGVTALPQELEAAAQRTEAFLQTETATIELEEARRSGDRLEALVRVENLAGHKLPSGYPSRRVWIEFSVFDEGGRKVFSSGEFRPDGSIAGNLNDVDPSLFEPHYTEIRSAEQVQIYEAIMVGPEGEVTTGLLTGVGYGKDNRLLPRGFRKAAANPDVGVHGSALEDDDFRGGGDSVRYSVPVAGDAGPLRIEVALWYQPIGRRWAENLRAYDAPETNRFVRYYDSMASSSARVIARATAAVR
jgi:hypothetical protein